MVREYANECVCKNGHITHFLVNDNLRTAMFYSFLIFVKHYLILTVLCQYSGNRLTKHRFIE